MSDNLRHASRNAAWRDPAQIASQWQEAAATEPALLRARVAGDWWEVLREAGATLVVSREYEHLLMALTMTPDGPRSTFMRLPHPSGIAWDQDSRVLHIASTRNPNQIYEFKPVAALLPRPDMAGDAAANGQLLPVRSRFLPGCLYLHDLALVGGKLHANAVGHNAIVGFPDAGGYERVWWPQCIERQGVPEFSRNHLQLNSIAAGRSLRDSYFSASTDQLSHRRPGHRNFAVDGRGVILSGRTRETVARGLTRPHSARLHRRRLWVANSGYGELGVIDDGAFLPVAGLPGWTRGLCFRKDIAFVGTSRVLARFRHYAPGLDLAKSVCGVHAVELRSGRILGSITWPGGDQVFAVACLPSNISGGFAFAAGGRRATTRDKRLFYSFCTEGQSHEQ